jgi:hypothetical protein
MVPVSCGESISTPSGRVAQGPAAIHFRFFPIPHLVHRIPPVIRMSQWLSTALCTATPQVTRRNSENTSDDRPIVFTPSFPDDPPLIPNSRPRPSHPSVPRPRPPHAASPPASPRLAARQAPPVALAPVALAPRCPRPSRPSRSSTSASHAPLHPHRRPRQPHPQLALAIRARPGQSRPRSRATPSRKPDSGHIGTTSTTIRVRRAS